MYINNMITLLKKLKKGILDSIVYPIAAGTPESGTAETISAST
jgi:hypothetical protein